MLAAFEPSSATNFLAPAARASASPAAVPPVNVTAATSGCAASALAVSRLPGTMLNSPSGSPARWKARAMISAVSTPCGAGLTTAAFPIASAGATFCTKRLAGALNGVIAPTTP